MKLAAIVLSLLITFAWSRSISRSPSPLKGVAKTVGIILMLTGAGGFLGGGLSAAGALNWLGDSFEWPAGYASGAITTSAGLHVVPLSPTGRVQIYDANWKFLRGWHIPRSGKPMHLTPTRGEQFHVLVAGSHMDYLFDIDGRLVSGKEYSSQDWQAAQHTGTAVAVPTHWWLLSFTDPSFSWITMMAGIVIQFLIEKIKNVNPLPKDQATATASNG